MEPPNYKGGMAVAALVILGFGVVVISIVLGLVLFFIRP